MDNMRINSNKNVALKELEDHVSVALEKIGLVAERYAKEICPVDTGRLRNSISHATDKDSAYIGTNVEYAVFIELGHSKKAPKGFLGPAVKNHIDEYRKIVMRELQQ